MYSTCILYYFYHTCRNIYFVIDGGSFYASKRHFSGSWSPYVPLSVFGPYRLSRSNSINSQPILPSPHCYPREKQFYFRPLEKRTPIRNITLRSARLVKNDGEKFEVMYSTCIVHVLYSACVPSLFCSTQKN